MKERLPDQVHLEGFKRCFQYYPENGRLVWVRKYHPAASKVTIGDDVGTVMEGGYRQLLCRWSGKSRTFKVHRICWYLHWGMAFP